MTPGKASTRLWTFSNGNSQESAPNQSINKPLNNTSLKLLIGVQKYILTKQHVIKKCCDPRNNCA